MNYRIRFFLRLIPIAASLMLLGPAGQALAAPANDNFANAQALTGTLPITVTGNNIGATAEPGEPDTYSIPPLSSVWFKWVAPAETDAVLDFCHANFSGGNENDSPVMAIRSGVTLGTLVSVKETNGPCSLRFHANAGVTYNFQIDWYDKEGTFDLTLRKLTPPANDNFATPTNIGPALPIEANGTTVDSNWEAGEPGTLGGSSNSRSVWFRWTAPATERVRLEACEAELVDGSLNEVAAIYTGATLGTLVEVAKNTSNDCAVDFPVVAGTTYRIAVSGHFGGEFTFVLRLKSAPPPTNDNFANAQVVGPNLPVKVSGNNDFATEEIGEPNHGGYPDTSRSVWYSWTAPVSGRIRVKACSPDASFFVGVYTGNTFGTLTDTSEYFYYAQCSRFFDAVAGTTYRFAVAGAPFAGTHGPFTFELRQVAIPGNDAFTSAIDLGNGVSITRTGTTVDATTEDYEPNHTGGYGGGFGGSVWYRWKAPNDKPVILQACSQTEANIIAVYRNNPESDQTAPGNLSLLDSDSTDCLGGTKGGRLAIAPVKGTLYFIAVVAALSDYESDFNLKIQGIPTSTKSAFNLKKAIAKCRKIKGKNAKAKRKRANCIKAARKKAAIIKCKKIKNAKSRNKCIKKARKRYR
ncbi:MAG: hypothetical protein KDB54_06925 [Solirubrobacterales bacterium]|nr:hypothetical protein [Solirubrobacterales bacterium]